MAVYYCKEKIMNNKKNPMPKILALSLTVVLLISIAVYMEKSRSISCSVAVNDIVISGPNSYSLSEYSGLTSYSPYTGASNEIVFLGMTFPDEKDVTIQGITINFKEEKPESVYYYTYSASTVTAPPIGAHISALPGAKEYIKPFDINWAAGKELFIQIYEANISTGEIKGYAEFSGAATQEKSSVGFARTPQTRLQITRPPEAQAEKGSTDYYTYGGKSIEAPAFGNHISTIYGAEEYTKPFDFAWMFHKEFFVQVYRVEEKTGKITGYSELTGAVAPDVENIELTHTPQSIIT